MKKGNELVRISKAATRDRVGDGTPGAFKFERKDAIIYPRTSTEQATRGEVVIDGLNVFLPGVMPQPITATDVVEARGEDWQIEGVPGEYRKGGRVVGVLLVVKRLV